MEDTGELNGDGRNILKSHDVRDTTAVTGNQGMRECGTENGKNDHGAHVGLTKKYDGLDELAYLDHHQAEHVGVGIIADVNEEGWRRGAKRSKGSGNNFFTITEVEHKVQRALSAEPGSVQRSSDDTWRKKSQTKNTVITSEDNCGFDPNQCKLQRQWGKEMGLKYGCAVEDVLTGLAIHCRGWRSIYFNPERKGFLGVAPTTLLQSLVQHKRWSEGDFQIFASRYCPFVHGYKKTPLMHQFAYCIYLLWAPTCLPTLYYVVVPSLCLLRMLVATYRQKCTTEALTV
ncbi:hypothetical protein FH972_000029 [Carpinus fangiana]|uniref:Glycosyltransferase 2-like domain-containing protein n=1 Tax=Carpinus fangiana TaxID=176857 RepID=A0A5N6Q9V9_9ROSI|nr:hypothetical protein FH972_000029 [Carpinus fangiana]